MEIKDGDVYPKYSFRISHEDKEWLERELEALKTKFNAGSNGSFPVVPKNALIMSALKRGIRYLRDDIHARCIQKNVEVRADVSKVWAALTEPEILATWWQPEMILEPRVGGEFVEPWTDESGGSQQATGVVIAAVPNEFIQFTWKEQTWTDGEETVCSFRLLPIEGSGTRIQLMHSGWEVFPGPKVAPMKEAFEGGWESLLGQLKKVLEQTSVSGAMPAAHIADRLKA